MFKAALAGIGLFRHRPYKMESHHSSGEPICNNFVLHAVGSWSPRSNFIRSSAGVLRSGLEKLGGSHKGSSRLLGDRFVGFQSALCLLCPTLQRFFILFFKHVWVCRFSAPALPATVTGAARKSMELWAISMGWVTIMATAAIV
jgi:hypothetical protein